MHDILLGGAIAAGLAWVGWVSSGVVSIRVVHAKLDMLLEHFGLKAKEEE